MAEIRWISAGGGVAKKKELSEVFEEELKLRPKNITNIVDLKMVPYPAGVHPPDLELNFPVEPGRFRYHRSFLLQFVGVCTERPVSLVPLDSIGLDPRVVVVRPDRRRVGRVGAMSANTAPLPLPTPFAGLSRPGFPTSNQPLPPSGDDQSRSAVFSATRSDSVPGTMAFGADAGGPRKAKRTRCQRGRERNVQPVNIEPVAPYVPSENRWIPRSTSRVPLQIGERQLVDLTVRGLLNKLTMQNFDLISDQIIDWANRSEQTSDGAILKQVLDLILEQAYEDTVFSEAYARLCRKIIERLSPNVQDNEARDSDCQSVAGGALFRVYLLNRCQEDFERRWDTEKATLVTSENQGEPIIFSDEYYAVARVKRQALGLARFMGELCNLWVLPEYVVFKCIQDLLSSVANHTTEGIECLCKLLRTVGKSLDRTRAKERVDKYFERMQEMADGSNISFRLKFMLMDTIELRARHWQPRQPRVTPLHQDPVRNYSGRRKVPRGGSGSEQPVNNVTDPDGWSVAGGAGTSRPAARAGDLSQFGKISKPTGLQFGPSSVFNKKEANKRGPSTGHAGGTNVLSIAGGGVASGSAPVNLGPGRFPATALTGERKKLNLLPKSKSDEGGTH
ncbi:unnamed protein product [Rhizoctonia solani]|uniref:MIF4G domain-containing protein n=1 Tax=Rhizoctonia solani TaxID=456999 RepID=A0A8H3HZI6_9AGAM|nr:unnamed protein product [Rhizoctonia solani]